MWTTWTVPSTRPRFKKWLKNVKGDSCRPKRYQFLRSDCFSSSAKVSAKWTFSFNPVRPWKCFNAASVMHTISTSHLAVCDWSTVSLVLRVCSKTLVQFCLHNKFKASLNFMRLGLKITKIKLSKEKRDSQIWWLVHVMQALVRLKTAGRSTLPSLSCWSGNSQRPQDSENYWDHAWMSRRTRQCGHIAEENTL